MLPFIPDPHMLSLFLHVIDLMFHTRVLSWQSVQGLQRLISSVALQCVILSIEAFYMAQKRKQAVQSNAPPRVCVRAA